MRESSVEKAASSPWRPGIWLFFGCAVVSAVMAVGIVDLHYIRKAGNPAESVPPAISVAVTVLVALGVWLILLALRRKQLEPRGILFLYACLLIAGPVAGIGLVTRFLPLIGFLPYRASEANHMLEFVPLVPRWLCPRDPEVIRRFFIGGADSVPWSAWAVPLGAWVLFFMVLFFGMFCLASIFRRQWVDREKLVFPLADIPVRFCGLVGKRGPDGAAQDSSAVPLFRTGVFWVGFGFAAALSALFILNEYYQFVPGFSRSIDFAGRVTKRPWVALSYDPAFNIRIVFTVIGLAFLIKQEISFSLWFTFLLIKVVQVGISSMGYTMLGFPYLGVQANGGYLALALFCLWLGRRHIADVLRHVFGTGPRIDDDHEPMSYRTAVIGFFLSFACLACFLKLAGMSSFGVSVILVFVLILVIAHNRIRAESGVPIAWAGPYAGIGFAGLFFNLFGIGWFNRTDLIMFAILGIFTIGYFPLLGATQLEAIRMAGIAGIRRKSMGVVLHLGCLVGMVVALAACLKVFYTHGLNQVASYEMNLWHQIASIYGAVRNAEELPRSGTILWTLVGTGFTGILIILRFVFLRFPIHPVGYVMLLTYGGKWMMGSVFIAWLVKALVLRYGGITMFRRLVPFFVGLVLGEISLVGLWFVLVRFMSGPPVILSWG